MKPNPGAMSATQRITEAAKSLGFCRVGFTPVAPLTQPSRALNDWLAKDYHGNMAYMAGSPRDDAQRVMATAKTLLVVALAYPHGSPSENAPASGHGLVARYARGLDYHSVLKKKLATLAVACSTILERPVMHRACVDTAPLLERSYAACAGVGFTAKSTLAIVPGVGSYVLLGELLLDVELLPSAPLDSKCGSCVACMQACPTGAFVSPYVMDARRCVSYLTIELRGPIPRILRPLIGNMIFGCDICQQVCPFNAAKKSRPVASELNSWGRSFELEELLHLGAAAYRRLVGGSAMQRATRQQLSRNAAVALGNSGRLQAIPSLLRAAASHRYALVRGHAAWAVGAIPKPDSRAALQRLRRTEADAWVREEIDLAIFVLGL